MIEDNIEFLTNGRACLFGQVLACYLGKCGNEARGPLGAIGFDRAYLRLMTRFSKRFEKEGLTNSLLSAFENFDDENWQSFAFILRYEANDRGGQKATKIAGCRMTALWSFPGGISSLLRAGPARC